MTRQQALALGMTDRSIRTQLANGSWQTMRTGVYLVGALAPGWAHEVLAACLAAGPDAVASHRTAARLWGFVRRSGKIEIQVADHRRVRLPGVTVHRSILVIDEDVVRPAGEIPRTSPARTITDLAPGQGNDVVGRWVDSAMRDHGMQLDDLIDCCNRLTVPGRPPPLAAMAAVAMRCGDADPGRSAFESRVIGVLRAAGLPEPVRQHPVVRTDGSIAYIDLAFPAPMVAIECDGWETHGIRSAFEPDRIRGNELVLLGWHLLRFSWSMPDEYIVASVRRALAAGGSAPGQSR
ncbi:MAG: hypothetical protein U0P45_15310 [Acidimicrobiales bacterium]